MSTSVARRGLPFVVLILEVVAFHWRILLRPEFAFPWDMRGLHWPLAELQAASLRLGQFPFWDNTSYFGRPLWANIQAQTFYPPRMLTMLLNHVTGGEHLFYLLELQQVAHIALSGVLAYLLLRRLGAGEAAAVLGGTVFQLSGFMASQAQHLGIVNAGAWLPLAWLGVVAMSERMTMRRVAVVVIALAMPLLAGHPSAAVSCVVSTVLLACGLVLARRAETRLIAATLGASVWALALAAVQLLPTAELNFHSISKYRDEWRTAGGLPLESLVSLVIPNYWGVFDMKTYSAPWDPTFVYLYSGLVALGLAVAAAFYRKDRNGVLFASLTVIGGFAMLGGSTPIGLAVYHLLPSRIQTGFQAECLMPPFFLGLAVLAGLGAHWYLRRGVWRWAAVMVVACELLAVSANRPFNTVDLRQEPGVTQEAFAGSRELLAGMRQLVNQASPPYRIDIVDESYNLVMTAPLTALPTGNGYDPLAPERVARARLAFCEGERWGATYPVTEIASPVPPALNIRYLVGRSELPEAALEGSGYQRAAALPGHQFYENPDAAPRFYLVSRLRLAAGLDDAARQLSSPDLHPRSEAIVEGSPTQTSFGDGSAGTVSVSAYTPNRVALSVDAPVDAYLVSSETHYPGWRATIDGEPAELHYTNVAFRGLEVPAGPHEIVMEFRPGIVWWAVGLSTLAALVLAWMLFYSRRRAV